MTVTYSADVATSSLACFLKLLLRWRGSIYKLMWKEFIIFFSAYYFFGVLYQFVLTRHETAKHVFEQIVLYCHTFSNLIPVAFILGFYINAINSRWWNQFCSVPWPDRTALYVAAYMSETSDKARLMRRTIVRYINLSIAMTLVAVSPRVKKRFPTLGHLTEAGILLPNEESILDNIQTPYNKYFIPLAWAMRLLTRCRKEGLITEDFALKTILDEITSIRSSLGMVFNYDWIPVPLVYTQVVTLAVHMFVLSTVFGQQTVDTHDSSHALKEIYFPFFTFLQFFFYMGWLKVAEQMVNPFGDDDDDFDVNFLLDRHIKGKKLADAATLGHSSQVAYLIVDDIHALHPQLTQDIYWDTVDFNLPYTKDTLRESAIPSGFNGSTNVVIVSPEAAAFVPVLEAEPEIAEIAEIADDEDTKSSMHDRPSSSRSVDFHDINPQPMKPASRTSGLDTSKTTSDVSVNRRRLSRTRSGPDTRNSSSNSNIRRLECLSELNLRGGTRVPKAKNHPVGGSDYGEQQQLHDFQLRHHRFQQHHQKSLQILRSSRYGRNSSQSFVDEARVGFPSRGSAENRSVFVETTVTYV